MATSAATLGVRWTFVLVALSLPVMLLVRANVGEAYPGLYQPAFDTVPAHGRLLTRAEAVVVVRDALGATRRVETADLVEAPSIDSPMIRRMVRSILVDKDALRSVAGRRWLEGRLQRLGFTDPVVVRITWYRTRRNADEPDRATRDGRLRTFAVRLGDAP